MGNADPSDWIGESNCHYMYNAGNPNTSWNGFEHLTTGCFVSLCGAVDTNPCTGAGATPEGKVYVLVQAEGSNTLEPNSRVGRLDQVL